MYVVSMTEHLTDVLMDYMTVHMMIVFLGRIRVTH